VYNRSYSKRLNSQEIERWGRGEHDHFLTPYLWKEGNFESKIIPLRERGGKLSVHRNGADEVGTREWKRGGFAQGDSRRKRATPGKVGRRGRDFVSKGGGGPLVVGP